MEKEEFDQMIQSLAIFAKDEFYACDTFIGKLQECKTSQHLKDLLFDYNSEIYERLDGFDVDELHNEISYLENEVEKLEAELGESKSTDDGSLHYQMKLDTFNKVQQDYDPWQFESLFKK